MKREKFITQKIEESRERFNEMVEKFHQSGDLEGLAWSLRLFLVDLRDCAEFLGEDFRLYWIHGGKECGKLFNLFKYFENPENLKALDLPADLFKGLDPYQ